MLNSPHITTADQPRAGPSPAAFVNLGVEMGARHKLNQAYLNGSLIVAAMVGVGFQSWLAFWIILALGVALDLWGGQIRPSSKNHRQRHDL